jgi:hypothetical protein
VAIDDGVLLWIAFGGSGGAGLWDYVDPVAALLEPIARVIGWSSVAVGDRSERGRTR